jgi:Zn-dependent protease with chaperone function
MDFFAQQDNARKQTRIMLVYFVVAVFFTILLVYFLPVLGWNFAQSRYGTPEAAQQVHLWHPELFALVCGGTLLLVVCGALYKIAQLKRGGGEGVAVMLGGKQIVPDTDDFFEKRLRNVVEEMAIASGVPVPAVYVMEHERGINAFAAGFTPSDSVVAVTYGTMTGLTREELQGVIAHEFSHILNNDMRMYINLMAIIHGLIVIGLLGRILLEFSTRGSRVRVRGGGGQIVVFVISAGIILWIVGSCGIFFASLIKAAISRSRERLADASAVQFTRNPSGLANALKKIGGLAAGSRIRSPNAEQASHMFFGKGTKGAFFSTHPPLVQRIQWLEPTFDGTLPEVSLRDLREQLTRFEGAPLEKEKKPSVVDLFTAPSKLAVTATILTATSPSRLKPNNPEALIDSIGQPMQQHADAAKQLLDSIPERAKEYARDPHGARMLIYFLLLDSSEAIRNKQMALIQEQAEPEVFQTLETALPNLGKIKPEMRLPIIDLSIPALRFLSPSQYAAFRKIVKQLILADNQVNIFEYALQRVLVRHLDPTFSGESKRRPVNYYAIRGLETETSVILSTLARNGHDDPQIAEKAFLDATEKIAAPKANFQFMEESECTWKRLNAALDQFSESSFKVKKWLLGAALACLMHDREITIDEVELFRAIADSLDCPVPPWVAPVTKQQGE